MSLKCGVCEDGEGIYLCNGCSMAYSRAKNKVLKEVYEEFNIEDRLLKYNKLSRRIGRIRNRMFWVYYRNLEKLDYALKNYHYSMRDHVFETTKKIVDPMWGVLKKFDMLMLPKKADLDIKLLHKYNDRVDIYFLQSNIKKVIKNTKGD